MQPGTEPLVVATTLGSILSEVAGFFSMFWITRSHPMGQLLALALVSPFAGGAVWQYLNKLNGWRFYLGGPNNEPYGTYAAIWGLVTLFPVIFAVRILTSERTLNSLFSVGRWFRSREFALVLFFVALAALCSLFFYGVRPATGVRAYVTSLGWRYEPTEQLMIVLWAAAISIVPTGAIALLGGRHTPRATSSEALLYALPFVLAIFLCLLGLSIYFALYDYVNLDQKAQIRGFMAGYVVRFAIFWGIWAAIDTRNPKRIWKQVKVKGERVFS